MRGLIARAGLAGLAASLLIHPAVAQNAQEPAAPPSLVFV